MSRLLPSTARAVLSGLLAGILGAGPAWAQAPLRLLPATIPSAASPRLAILVVGIDPMGREEVANLTYLAEQAVARFGRFEPVRLVDALDVEGARSRQAAADAASAAFKAGLAAYDELDTRKALEHFDAALRAYEGTDLTRRFSDLSRAWVMKIAAQVANGERRAAQLEIDALLAVDPRATFSENYFPPGERAYAEKARRTMSREDTLEVKTDPVNAQVFVDGQFRGVSPLNVKGLPRADHYVTVVAPGYAVTQGRARDGAQTFTLKPAAAGQRLEDAVQAIASEPDGPDRDAAARELGAFVGAEQVLVLVLRKGPPGALDVTGLRLDVQDGHNYAYRVGTVQPGDPMVLGAEPLLTAVLASDAPRAGGPITHFSGTRASSLASFLPRKQYLLLGAGGALLASSIAFGLQASAKQKQYKELVQTHGDSPAVRSQGRTFAVIADVGLIAGLISTGLGGYLIFKDWRSRRPAKSTELLALDELPMPPPPTAGADRPKDEKASAR